MALFADALIEEGEKGELPSPKEEEGCVEEPAMAETAPLELWKLSKRGCRGPLQNW